MLEKWGIKLCQRFLKKVHLQKAIRFIAAAENKLTCPSITRYLFSECIATHVSTECSESNDLNSLLISTSRKNELIDRNQ